VGSPTVDLFCEFPEKSRPFDAAPNHFILPPAMSKPSNPENPRAFVQLSIGGVDPTGGAGIAGDC
jgi:hypothetical protein